MGFVDSCIVLDWFVEHLWVKLYKLSEMQNIFVDYFNFTVFDVKPLTVYTLTFASG